jgi:hypothetical protein
MQSWIKGRGSFIHETQRRIIMGARFHAAAGALITLAIIEYTGPARAASWQNFSSTNQPTVDYKGLSVPIGGNALIAAVEDEVYGGYYDLEVLGESSNSNGHHMNSMFPIVPYGYGDGPPEYVWSSSGKAPSMNKGTVSLADSLWHPVFSRAKRSAAFP